MADEKRDNCEVIPHSPMGGYGAMDNTGAGILSGAVSHSGRGIENERKDKPGLLEKIKKNYNNRKSH